MLKLINNIRCFVSQSVKVFILFLFVSSSHICDLRIYDFTLIVSLSLYLCLSVCLLVSLSLSVSVCLSLSPLSLSVFIYISLSLCRMCMLHVFKNVLFFYF